MDIKTLLNAFDLIRGQTKLQVQGKFVASGGINNYLELAMARRSGKTTALTEFAQKLLRRGNRILYLTPFSMQKELKDKFSNKNIWFATKPYEMERYRGLPPFDYILADEINPAPFLKYPVITSDTNIVRLYTPQNIG